MKGEVAYSWDIDPSHRAWFITSSGKLLGNKLGHNNLIKTEYSKEWADYIDNGEESSAIEARLENRILKAGGIKIGEVEEFSVEVRTLDNDLKDMLAGFARSLLKVRPSEKETLMRIEELFVKKVCKYTLEKIANEEY